MYVVLIVLAVSAPGALRLGQQAPAFVVADRLDVDADAVGELADLHDSPPCTGSCGIEGTAAWPGLRRRCRAALSGPVTLPCRPGSKSRHLPASWAGPWASPELRG